VKKSEEVKCLCFWTYVVNKDHHYSDNCDNGFLVTTTVLDAPYYFRQWQEHSQYYEKGTIMGKKSIVKLRKCCSISQPSRRG